MIDADRPENPSSPSRDDALKMFRAGLDKGMQAAAANYAIPLCWIRAENRKPLIVGSGTAFVLDCGAGPYLVTAAHVYQGFVDAQSAHADCVCFAGDIKFDLADRNRLIASDPAHDVATIRLDADEVEALQRYGKYVLTGSQTQWPPAPPKEGRGVFFVGFPGDGRSMRPQLAPNVVEIDWIGYTALAIATSVSDAGVLVVLNHDPTFDISLRPEIPPDWALGGCSGAPLLAFTERRGIFSWQLAGVITEASKVIVRAARANCLNADGSLNTHPDPMAYRARAS
jgi:hypothetical protein